MLAKLCVECELREAWYVRIDGFKYALITIKKSAPGPSDIWYENIGKLSDSDMEALCTEYNNSIQKAVMPEDWMYSFLIWLRQHGKDTTQINRYRVIAMQDSIGKLLEKIIVRKVYKL